MILFLSFFQNAYLKGLAIPLREPVNVMGPFQLSVKQCSGSTLVARTRREIGQGESVWYTYITMLCLQFLGTPHKNWHFLTFEQPCELVANPYTNYGCGYKSLICMHSCTCWAFHARKASRDGSRDHGSFHEPTRPSSDYYDSQQHPYREQMQYNSEKQFQTTFFMGH